MNTVRYGMPLIKIVKYGTILDKNRLPRLIEERVVHSSVANPSCVEGIAAMMNGVFFLDRQTEEYVYELCFNAEMKLIGVFEVSHGTLSASFSNPREIFQKALLCGAASVIVVHNHPSGSAKPSRQDCSARERLARAGEMIGIRVMDSLIIGKDGDYYSFYEEGHEAEQEAGCEEHVIER